MAQAAGERLGPVCSLTDDSTPDYAAHPVRDGRRGAAQSAKAAVPLEPGTQQVSAQITLVYA